MTKLPSKKKAPAINRHKKMVDDPQRTPLIQKAIQKLVKPGHTVLDLGCGTGVLSLMALNQKTKFVFAFVVEDAIDVAIDKVKKNGFSDRTFFFKGLSSEMVIPQKMDIIISETIGTLGLDENILPFVADAKKRFLKNNGVIIPKNLKVFVAPIHHKRALTEAGFTTAIINSTQLLAHEKKYCDIEFLKNKKMGMDCEMEFTFNKDGICNAFAVWVEIEWTKGLITKTSPFDPPTHWKQGLLPLGKNYPVKKNQSVIFRLRIFPKDTYYSTESLIEWGFQIQK